MRTRLMRGKFALLFMTFGILLAIPAIAFAQDVTGSTPPAPTIQSDQADYAPGDTVTLTGSNWQPGEVVHINVNDNQTQPWSRDVDVTADASGNITDQFQLPTTFAALYNVTATGPTSGTVTTTFTDANLRFLSSGPTLSSISWQKYSNNTCTTAISGAGNSGSGDITSTDSQIGTLNVDAGNANTYVGLTAPATAGGKNFVDWTRTSNNNAFTTSGPGNRTICAQGDPSNGTAKFMATYLSTPAVTIDNTSPATLGASGNSTITWHADENGTFSVRVGGTNCTTGTQVASGNYTTQPNTTTTNVSASSLSEGANTIRVCVTNSINNSGSATTTVTKDTTGPSVSSISGIGPSPTNAPNVLWQVTFNEPVSGVNITSGQSDFTLANTGLGGTPAITSLGPLSGPSATYTVGASTGSGSGSLGLNLNDNDSITDAQGNKLGGTGTGTAGSGGTGNGSFTGEVFAIDRTAPNVVIDSTVPSTINSTGSSTITWHANENGTFSVRVGGTNCTTGTQVASGNYTTQPNTTTTTVNAADLANGANTVRVCVTDGVPPSPNTGSATTTITKNPVQSTSVGSITATTSTYGGTTNLSATVTPSGAPGSVAFYVNGSSTPAAGTVAYDPSTGVATLSNYAHGLDASTTAYSVKAVFTSSSANYTNSEATNNTALTVNKKTVTGSFSADDKVYDGTTAATGTRSLSGAISGDDVSLTGGTATFDNKNVANGKTVTLSGASLSGADAGNYVLASGPITDTANITAKQLTVSATGVNKQYDGNADATVTLSDNRVSGDILNTSYTNASFNDKNVANGKPVSVSGISVTGTDAGNYTFNTTASTTADITVRAITVTAVADSKTYDGTISSDETPTVGPGSIASGDTANFSQAFANKNVGTGKTLTPSGSVDDDNNGNNYSVTFVDNNNGTITKAPLDISAVSDTKVYDGTKSSSKTPTVSGLQGTDTVTNKAQQFQSKDVLGTGNSTLEVTTYTVNDGNSGGNYNVTTHTASGTITKAPLTVTADDKSKKLGDPNPTFTASYSGFVNGEGTSVLGGTLNFATNVPNPEQVGTWDITPSGLTSSNYNISFVSGKLTITYKFDGFRPPVDNPGTGATPVFNSAKAGQAIPIKFSLSGNQGLDIIAAGYPKVTSVNCVSSATVDPLEEYAAVTANGGLNYDASANQYNYVWKTQSAYANKCFKFDLTLKDGTSHVAYFKFLK